MPVINRLDVNFWVGFAAGAVIFFVLGLLFGGGFVLMFSMFR